MGDCACGTIEMAEHWLLMADAFPPSQPVLGHLDRAASAIAHLGFLQCASARPLGARLGFPLQFLRARLGRPACYMARTIHQRGGAAVPRAPPAGQLAAAGLVACDRVNRSAAAALVGAGHAHIRRTVADENDLRYITGLQFGALWIFPLDIYIFRYFHDFYYLCIFDIYGFNVTVSISTMFQFKGPAYRPTLFGCAVDTTRSTSTQIFCTADAGAVGTLMKFAGRVAGRSVVRTRSSSHTQHRSANFGYFIFYFGLIAFYFCLCFSNCDLMFYVGADITVPVIISASGCSDVC